MMMDDETLQMYVEEAAEHLGDIENDLLAIEQAGADIDVELVNKVFRAAHSIKGGAGFLGLTKIKDLGHKIENILDMVRNRELVPEPEVVNIVLLAFDKLRDLISNVAESNDAYIDDHVAALTAAASANLEGEEKASVDRLVEVRDNRGRVVFEVAEFDLLQNKKGGKNLYLLEFDLIHDVQRKNKTIFDILKGMDSTGVILDLKVDFEAVGTLEDDDFSNRIPFFVLFGSIIEDDIMPALLDLGSEFITTLSIDLPSDQAAPVADFAQELLDQTPQTPNEDRTDSLISELFSGETLASALAAPAPKPAAPAAPVAPAPTAPAAPAPRPEPQVTADEDAGRRPDPKAPKSAIAQPDSLRVHVSLLEDLMNLAGELVLSRNQLMQAISSGAIHQIEVAGQRIDLVTSELQETIMLTRMQTVGNIFNKFPRVVRDLARNLGKEIDLQLEGNDVELDKTIIEGLGDPLTHLVRNSADHGIEMPDVRVKAGKQAMGTIVLKAYHEAGQVIIEIVDDGGGLDTEKIVAKALSRGLISPDQAKSMSDKEKANLIFLPGLSTAEQVTDVSGRGVGMDVVKSNLDQLGGQVDIETERGKGTTIRIKLPLTLAIIPSLLVSVGQERYAIPQVNVDELLRIPVDQITERVELVGDAEVLLLRGELIPLLYLSNVLGLNADSCEASKMVGEILRGEKSLGDIRESGCASADVNLVVVSAGQFRYGLVVDQLHDSVEIVVKPLGRHFKECQGYAGATIMGDGHVALILDVAGLGRLGDLSLSVAREAVQTPKEAEAATGQEKLSLFVFRNTPQEYCAVPLDLVARVELIDAAEIEEVGGRRVIKYRGGTLPVFSLDQATNVGLLDISGELIVIVFLMAGHEIGLLAKPPVDAIEAQVALDSFTLKQPGISGSAVIGDKTTLIVDIYELIQTVQPDWFAVRGSIEIADDAGEVGVPHLLLVEDSDFFRNQVRKFIEDDGYMVDVAEDGVVAWNMLDADPEKFDLVVTDIEMPNMDGFELSRRIRQDRRFSMMPIVALTSLAGDEDVARGKAVGIDDYQVKLDKERLLQSIYEWLKRYAS
ncbi:two-component system, chemotaxis family, sensor kinase CheA [Desulfomicrobium norvegicum]|uniref:histidine kinase n=1 Tax=Desulfomicrobium norvegicum (strain DSM 1741 / NCIMB 8310) TaxID=52561 RepID=A0A8G2C526_DESNO|nr:chemotaxis protein CheW [Desulfomicrobium norvegicum]SFM04823.1 two-component system, chemotaxis family, sensor kinase CheA [Desulfomicrobium norvegicum]